jgi:hypothetical protein
MGGASTLVGADLLEPGTGNALLSELFSMTSTFNLQSFSFASSGGDWALLSNGSDGMAAVRGVDETVPSGVVTS